MPIGDYYTPKDVQSMVAVSASGLRNYTRDYARWLSMEATETPRRFTEDDVRLIAFIVHCTKERAMTHAQVVDRLQDGDLQTFTWQIPQAPETPIETPEDVTGHLVPVERVMTAQALLQDAQRRENEASDKVDELQSRINELERELGEARGQLKSRYRSPDWWRKLFGGSG